MGGFSLEQGLLILVFSPRSPSRPPLGLVGSKFPRSRRYFWRRALVLPSRAPRRRSYDFPRLLIRQRSPHPYSEIMPCRPSRCPPSSCPPPCPAPVICPRFYSRSVASPSSGCSRIVPLVPCYQNFRAYQAPFPCIYQKFFNSIHLLGHSATTITRREHG